MSLIDSAVHNATSLAACAEELRAALVQLPAASVPVSLLNAVDLVHEESLTIKRRVTTLRALLMNAERNRERGQS